MHIRLYVPPFVQLQIKEYIKAPRLWPLWMEFAGDRWIHAQRASNAENVSIWWRHYVLYLPRWGSRRRKRMPLSANQAIQSRVNYIMCWKGRDFWPELMENSATPVYLVQEEHILRFIVFMEKEVSYEAVSDEGDCSQRDDVIKWTHFQVICPIWGSSSHRWIILTRTVMRSFDVFFDLRLKKRLSKQSRRRSMETPSLSV